MNNKGIIIQGSARSNGNTNIITRFIQNQTGYDLVDLNQKNIHQFDYDFKNRDDDFIPLIREIADQYQVVIFATPVYWYTMSGIMKNFFDRILECLRLETETGRKLKGKRMGMISCGSGPDIKKGFSMPFQETANYLSMTYCGDVHTWIENKVIPELLKPELLNFVKKVTAMKTGIEAKSYKQ